MKTEEMQGLKDYEIDYLHYLKKKRTVKAHLDKEEQQKYPDLSYL